VTGLFLFMGLESLLDGDVYARMIFPFVQEKYWCLLSLGAALQKESFLANNRAQINVYTLIQLVAFGIVLFVTQTIASIAFPVLILLLVPLRFRVLPRFAPFFTPEFFDTIDQPLIEAAEQQPSSSSSSSSSSRAAPAPDRSPEYQLTSIQASIDLGPQEAFSKATEIISQTRIEPPPPPDLIASYRRSATSSGTADEPHRYLQHRITSSS
jgi:hypothetical protein